jgi:hypothetical protein
MAPSRHHCALVDPARDVVLVLPHDPPRLPVLEEEWPKLRHLARTVGAPTAWPAAPPFTTETGEVVDVLVARAHDHLVGRLEARRWWPLAHAGALGLGPAATQALVTSVRELRDGAPADGRPAWWRAGWVDAVDAWVDGVLAERGERRLGPGEPVKVWSLSAVVRYRVADGTGRERDLWFKQPCDGFRAEPAIHAWVAAQVPDLVPALAGVDVDRAWLLVENVEETDDQVDPRLLAAVAAAHARAQLATLFDLDGLMRSGAPDRGAAPTVAGLQRVLPASKALPWLLEAVMELYSAGLPVSLVHGDLHLWNVGRRPDGAPVVFDWTDACVAHPYLDGRHLATSVGRSLGAAAADVVRDAYLGVWAASYPTVDHRRVWDLARVVDRAFTLLSYDAIVRALRPLDAWEHVPVVAQLVAELEGMAAGQ